MSIFIPLRRATLLIPTSAENQEHLHLYTLLTDPKDNASGKKSVLIVSISSVYNKPDCSCLLYKGDHPFIKHDSYVSYRHARIVEDVDTIVHGVNTGSFIPKEPFNGVLFARICKGLEDSEHTPRKCLEFYKRFN